MVWRWQVYYRESSKQANELQESMWVSQAVQKEQSATLLHRTMAHFNRRVINRMTDNWKYGVSPKGGLPKHGYNRYLIKKQVRTPLPRSLLHNFEKTIGRAVISDTFQRRTIGGKRYFFEMTSTPHRYTEVHVLQQKSELGPHIPKEIAFLERATWSAVKRRRKMCMSF